MKAKALEAVKLLCLLYFVEAEARAELQVPEAFFEADNVSDETQRMRCEELVKQFFHEK